MGRGREGARGKLCRDVDSKLKTMTEKKYTSGWLVESGSPYITRRTAQARPATLEGKRERDGSAVHRPDAQAVPKSAHDPTKS